MGARLLVTQIIHMGGVGFLCVLAGSLAVSNLVEYRMKTGVVTQFLLMDVEKQQIIEISLEAQKTNSNSVHVLLTFRGTRGEH